MCRKVSWLVIVSVAVLIGSDFTLSAAEGIGRPDTSSQSKPVAVETLQAKEPAEAKNATEAVRDAATDFLPSETAVPTRAKRRPSDSTHRRETSALSTTTNAEPKGEPEAAEDKAATSIKPAKSADPLKPIPDIMESEPAKVEAASFKGVTPGASTKADVAKAWGQPKEIARQDGGTVQLYAVEPFDRVEVNYSEDRVSSVVVRFEHAYPAAAVAKQLELTEVRPVVVSNELGEVLGMAYPERGVLFSFEADKNPQKPSMNVLQLILEPITAEPFILRAETTLEKRCDLSRRDLEQALAFEPDHARAHWLHSRALITMGEQQKAAVAIGRAIQLEPENPQYHITHAQVLAQLGRLPEALAAAQKAVAQSGNRPHIKARALCLVGDLTASGAKPDFKRAIALHSQALQMADALSHDRHPAIRVTAKEVLIDAHLGAAHDIAWGDWKEKSKAVGRWLERALAVADDLLKNEGGNPEHLFHVYTRAMAAYVGVRDGIDPEPTVNAVVDTGAEVIAAARDPMHKAQLQRDLGMALYDAVQICQVRSEYDNALKYGEQAVAYLAEANEAKQSTSSALLLGRLYFRLGIIHAARNKDHRAAVRWFDKAIPQLERPAPEELAADLGRHGEAFVSMAVSYWEAGQREKAVDLNEKGIQWMEHAVEQGTLDRSALTVPYNNLATMHRKLGSTEKADRFEDLASRAKDKTS